MARASKTSGSKTTTSSGALIQAPELLFDGPKVAAAISAAMVDAGSSQNKRTLISNILADANSEGRAIIKSAFDADPYVTKQAILSYSFLMDQVIQTALDAVKTWLHPLPTPTEAEKISLLAVGGYGRQEMAPFSDVDLLFLSPYKLSPWSESVVESMLYVLWDMRLKVGHATRTVNECLRLAKSDFTIRTALLESRYLGGDAPLAQTLEDRLWSALFTDTGAEFVEEKLAERARRHQRQGGQRYMLEPNVKEGKGGLRDLQSLFWITKYLSRAKDPSEMIAQGYLTRPEYDRFAEAEQFLWTVRCHLHLIVGRASEQLNFDSQVEIAQILGFADGDGLRDVERFMQTYFRHATHVGDLTRVFLTALEAQHVKQQPSIGSRLIKAMRWDREKIPKGYKLVHGRLSIADDAAFLSDPLNILRIFEEGLREEILIHPDAMRLITSNLDLIDDDVRGNPEAQRIFLDLMLAYGNPERALRRMNELGVLGAFVPEFQRVVALMQFNMYHHYTVDEHTIQCISNLSQIERRDLVEDLPVASGILESGVNRRVLYVALLLHDIGKGLPEEHSIVGARMAETIAPRLGLDEKETETVVWLIREHLLMSDVAQKRDLSDPRTVLDFTKAVQTTMRLKLLTVLTVCDIRGVGPGTWNNWKAQLLRDLYWFTLQAMQQGHDHAGAAHPIAGAKDALATALSDWSEEDRLAELDRHYDGYWQGLDQATHEILARLRIKTATTDIASDIEPDEDRAATRACFVMEDHPGIFSRLTGALALVGANIVDARTYTSSDGYATSVFWIQDADGAPYEKSRLTRLRSIITKILKGEMVAREALKDKDKIKKRERDFIVPTEIMFDNKGSDIYTIIEVDTRDRPGLLHDLTRSLSASNIYIASAVIATYGAQAVDVFYVKDMFGLKVHSKSKFQMIEAKLREAIDSGAKRAVT